jgi:hypothetical protein
MNKNQLLLIHNCRAMKMQFQTKEESNKKQLEEFLKLSGIERIYSFLNLAYKVNQYPTKNKVDKSENFILSLKSK